MSMERQIILFGQGRFKCSEADQAKQEPSYLSIWFDRAQGLGCNYQYHHLASVKFRSISRIVIFRFSFL